MNIITVNIYNDIKELSDIHLQRKLWLNENNDTGYISSYIEAINRLFDDDNFDDNSAFREGFSIDIINDFDKLRSLLNEYQEKDTEKEILNDPNWHVIVNFAKSIVKKWNYQ